MKTLFLFLLFFPPFFCHAENVKYVFLLIGDGFGVNQRILTERAVGRPLALSSMPVRLRQRTGTVYDTLTDSPAGGTALACGIKTALNHIGVDAEGNAVESLAELLKKHGFKIGLISSSPLNDATPAAFYAHQCGRGNKDAIHSDLLRSGTVDYLGGAELSGKTAVYLKEMKEQGWTVLRKMPAGVFKPKTYLISRPYVSWPDAPEKTTLSLAEHLRAAIRALENPKGFFLMLEQGQTDYAGHANDAGKVVRETLAFDEVVREALAFQEKHPEETLIVVTADHETGGLELENAGGRSCGILLRQRKELTGINSELAGLRKQGKMPSGDKAIDFLQNKLGLDSVPFTPREREKLRTLGKAGSGFKSIYGSYSDLVIHAFRIRDARLGIAFTTFYHSPVDVGLYVKGPGQERFRGVLENALVPHLIKDIVLGESVRFQPCGRAALEAVEKYAVSEVKTDGLPPIAPPNARVHTSVLNGRTMHFHLPGFGDSVSWRTFRSDHGVFLKIFNTGGEPHLFTIRSDLSERYPYKYDFHRMTRLPNCGEILLSPDSVRLILLSRKKLDSFAGKEEPPVKRKTAAVPARVFSVRAAEKTPGIDGVLNHEEWRAAPVIEFEPMPGKELKNRTEMRLLSGGPGNKFLFLGFKVFDDDLRTGQTEHDGRIWLDDCLDIQFASARDERIQFIFNSRGVFYDSKNGSRKWNAEGVKCAARISPKEKYWTLEVMIPLSNFQLETPISAGFFRVDHPGDVKSGIRPSMHFSDRSRWSTLLFEDDPMRRLNYRIRTRADAGVIERTAASELACALQKIYRNPIRLNGRIPESLVFDIAACGKLNPPGCEFRVDVDGDRILLGGVDEPGADPAALEGQAGTILAVYYFLQKYAGVWYFAPGPEGESFPLDPELNLPSEDHPVPAYVFRGMVSRTLDGGLGAYPRKMLCSVPLRFVRNYNYSFAGWGKRFQAERPELLGLYDGKRKARPYPRHMPCFGNPEVVRIVAADISAAAQKRKIRTIRLFDDMPVLQCECERCRTFPDASEWLYTAGSRIAHEVHRKHPYAVFDLHSKDSYYFHAPRLEKMEKNMNIHLSYRGNPEEYREWRNAGVAPCLRAFYRFPIWKDYFQAPYSALKKPLAALKGIADGMMLRDSERAHLAGELPLLYLQSRLLFDPDREIDELLKEFCASAYPGAEDAMFRFFKSSMNDYDDYSAWILPFHGALQIRCLERNRKFLEEASGSVRRRVWLDPLIREYDRLIRLAEPYRGQMEKFHRTSASVRPEPLKLPLHAVRADVAEWEKISPLPLIPREPFEGEYRKSAVRIASDGRFLKFRFEAEEPEMKALRANYVPGGKYGIWSDDTFEIFLAAPGGGFPRLQLVCNAKGQGMAMLYPSYGCRREIPFPCRTASSASIDEWRVELQLPLEQLPAPVRRKGKALLGVYRIRQKGAGREFQISGLERKGIGFHDSNFYLPLCLQ